MKRICLVVCILLGAGTKSIAQSCRAADARSARMVTTLNRLMTGTAKDNQTRINLHLPSVASGQIVLVSDSAVCAHALQVLDSVIHATNAEAPMPIPARPLYVIQVGSYLAVSDPNDRSEGHVIINFFNPSWALVSILGWPAGPDPE